jgi:hypothetical protein
MSQPIASFARLPAFLRSLVGLALAPIIGGAVVFGAIGVLELAKGRIELLRMAGMGAYFGALFGAPAAVLIGWPIHLLLLKLRWTHVAVYVALGAALGIAGFLAAASVYGGLGID